MGRKRLRAIDLYSGVGGWSLGLRLAGVDVVASYERWGQANETNFKNNQHQTQTIDIRRLSLNDLPTDIDLVVGSPPCTQFSYSNRGGQGDISDGLKDIVKFLSIVDHLKPRYWVMENVPRVAGILEQELTSKGRLKRFTHLGCVARVFNMEEFGLPQRRRRCLAGNINFELLASYRAKLPKITLGNVVTGLSRKAVVDPIFGVAVPASEIHDHVTEASLSDEEVRINRSVKTLHPVYNSMAFPDPLSRSVRTITATCTRVSRESIVIANPAEKGKYRRLTLRERASLQGFPIVFQFYGDSYSQKQKMVGNAVPPPFAYLVAHAMRRTSAERLLPISNFANKIIAPTPPALETPPDRPGTRYPPTRTFRFAIPSLRLKSGVRFELSNAAESDWGVEFFFGTSKSIQSLTLDGALRKKLLSYLPPDTRPQVEKHLARLTEFIRQADIANMQSIWSHRGPGRTRPFMMLDELDQVGGGLAAALSRNEELAQSVVRAAIQWEFGKASDDIVGIPKLERNAPLIAAGLLVASTANAEFIARAPRLLPGRGAGRRA